MAGSVTGIATTFDLPNYHGELIALTPSDTPLLSASGGLSGGKQTDGTSFEWSDLRPACGCVARPPGRCFGADLGGARPWRTSRTWCQIFHETVETSYTKAAAANMFRTAGAAPFNSNSGPNAVPNEHSWQVMQSLKQIARDVNYCFWHGVKVKPTTNGTARAMGGLLPAATTNAQLKAGRAVRDCGFGFDGHHHRHPRPGRG